jgi:hypothetical protein
MPWKIVERSGKYCVIKETSGETEACHATRAEAKRHMAALYANEPGAKTRQEGPMDKAVWSTAFVNDLPDSSFLYVEPGEKDGEGKRVPRSKRHFPYKDASGKVDLPHLRNAIARIPQSNASGLNKRTVQDRARRILQQQQKGKFESIVDWLKEALGLEEKQEERDRFMVWKEGDRWRWLAIYSNKFRDRDNPPEILAEAAHKDFVDAVDKGDWNYPELWLWHTPGTKSGNGDFLAYDDRGFTLASGLFAEGKGHVAQALKEQDDLGVSHGMPLAELERDTEDPSIITRYRSKEISPLPSWAAANALTGFVTLEATNMALPEDKKTWLEGILGADDMKRLEETIDAKAKEAEGLEYKDGAESETEVEQAAEPEPEPQPEAVEEPPDYVTRDEVAEALTEITGRIGALAEQMGEFGKALKELKESEDERIAKAAMETPAASLLDIVRGSVIGSDATLVDGRTKLAKAGPKETEPNAEKAGAAGIVRGIFEDWRSSIPEATQ